MRQIMVQFQGFIKEKIKHLTHLYRDSNPCSPIRRQITLLTSWVHDWFLIMREERRFSAGIVI